MKIVQIGAYMWGAQKIIEEGIHNYAIEKGHGSYILYVRGQSEVTGTIKCETRLENLLTRGLRKLFGKHAQFSLIQTLRIICYLQRIRPNLVHLHVLHGATDYSLLLYYLGKKQIPVVYTMHDMWAHTGGCYHTGKCQKYQTACVSCVMDSRQMDEERENVQRSFQRKKRLLLQLNQLHCVAVSNWVANEMKKGFLSVRPISVIYNGIDFEESPTRYPTKQRLKDKCQIISVAASWGESKGFDIIIDLARMLGSAFEIILVGNTTVGQRNLNPGNIVFYGECSNRKELFSLFQNADLHVTASRAETFGMTIVEAAMAGTRSIGFSCTAVGEILGRVNGISVSECTAEALYDAILEVCKQSKCKLSTEEIKCVYEQFSVRRMAEEYVALYENMVLKQ